MTNPDPALARRIHWILWSALLASQAVYAGLAASGVFAVGEPPADLPLPTVLGGLALGCGLGAHVLWRRAAGEGLPIHAEPRPGLPIPTGYLVAWVLDEAIAVFGLVLAFLSFPLATWAAFSVAAVVLTVLHRPR